MSSYLLTFLSGLLIIFSFPNFIIPRFSPCHLFFAWMCLVPLFFALEKRPNSSFKLGFLAGLIASLGKFYWLAVFTPQYPIVILGLVLLAAYLALYLAFFTWLSHFFASRLKWPLILIAPPLWVALEFLQAYLFTGFPWLLLGYSQYLNLPLLQLCSWTGVYGVSFLVVLFNLGIFSFIKKKNFVLASLALGLVGLAHLGGIFGLSSPVPSSKEVRVGLIQPNIGEEKSDFRRLPEIFHLHLSLSKEIAKKEVDLIIWPETGFPSALAYYSSYLTSLIRLAEQYGCELVVGATHEENGKYYNSAFLISERGIKDRYDKVHLVPYGEYILGERFLPWLKKILQIGTYTPGKKGKVIRNRSFPLAVLICFESIFPELSRASVKEGGRILVNITNDAWFKKTAAPYQHALMSIVRAVENRTPLIRAANTGVSLAVSASGKLLTKTEIFRKTVRKVKIKVRNTPSKSFYTQWGDVFVFVCLFYLGVLVFLKFLKKT